MQQSRRSAKSPGPKPAKVSSPVELTKEVEFYTSTWLPQVLKVTENPKWQDVLSKMQKDQKQNPLKQTFADLRLKYIDDVVPQDWKKRKDFIMNNEFAEACQILGERY